MEQRVAAALDQASAGPLTVDITTTGRRSGEPRRIEIWVVKVGERVVIGGTPGARDWIANLRRDPRMTLHLKGDPDGVVADLPGTATELLDPAVRREVWEHPATHWYRTQTDVDDLVANAPTVEFVVD